MLGLIYERAIIIPSGSQWECVMPRGRTYVVIPACLLPSEFRFRTRHYLYHFGRRVPAGLIRHARHAVYLGLQRMGPGGMAI